MADEEKTTPEKKPAVSSRPAAKKPSAPEPEREEIKGVIHTSRIGAIEPRSPLLNPEEHRHAVLADAKKPGDDDYNPYTDPLIPTSDLQQAVAMELAGGDESPTWDALHTEADRAARKFKALKEFDEQDFAEAS